MPRCVDLREDGLGRAVAGRRVIMRMHANEHPDGPPADVADALRAVIPELHRYPPPVSALETAIAELHDVPLNRVLVGAGSAEVISLAWRAFTGPDRPAFFHEPEFELYALLGAQCGTPTLTRAVGAADSYADLSEYLADRGPVGLVALSNPHNPTGAFRPRRAVADLVAALPATTVVLNDEAYHDYADPAADELPLAALSELPNVLTTRTFSKIHGLAGLRVGYGIGHASLIGALRSLQTPFSVSAAGCVAALAALADPESPARRREGNRLRRQELADALAGRGFDVTPSQANFLYARPPREPGGWAARLLDLGVRVAPAGDGLRVTVGTAAELAALLTAVDEILATAT
ncbi:histidinol phosphate aminotransferase apoenzyme [Actinokineospora alba]|uniref:Histidinol phosphate aminotransferase apoenzyme n=1 Tax=Actinokineospora alba TaxID=504798 RepID=A0A1H0W228_9PSEU|nr:histidinol-phosphate transaminase [Actinokineospora alba]TDP67788.1 histidinol phosphate aminotransferase [Actinokineospora alba]SDI71876.1 histidinol-phosphate aminotransferase [Actinokineospora alba]SDP84780.1 histidinol phosphate aminotransferase apoenzyme [Actinokineospora alba]